MTKVFISQPMNGLSNEEIKKERDKIISKLDELLGDFEVIDSFIEGTSDMSNNPVYCLSKSIGFLAEADLAVFARGWQNNRECRIERDICVEYNISTLDLDMESSIPFC